MTEEISYRSPTYYELAAPPELDWRPHRPQAWHDYRAAWEARPQTKDAGSFPLHLDIDPTSRCNLRCSMCPRTYLKDKGAPFPLGDISFDFYARLITEGAANGLQSIKLNFLGEPLLYPRLPEMVALAAEKGLWVMLNTNATLLTEALGRDLLKAGLTDIFFSVDSPYPAEYEAVRVGANFNKTISNIAAFMELKTYLGKNALQTRASMVLPENSEAPDLARIKADYIKLFRNLGVAEIGFGLPSVMGFDYNAAYGLFPDFICPDLFRRMFVFWDGPVGPCCGDWERRLIMGNAHEKTIAEIWLDEPYLTLRAAHIEGNYGQIPACRTCSVPYLSTQG